MKLKIFTIYDSKVEAFLQPFFMRTPGEAFRAFEETCGDPKTNFAKHPADYTLFQIGEYDEESGVIESLEAKINLGTALQVISKSKHTNENRTLKEA